GPGRDRTTGWDRRTWFRPRGAPGSDPRDQRCLRSSAKRSLRASALRTSSSRSKLLVIVESPDPRAGSGHRVRRRGAQRRRMQERQYSTAPREEIPGAGVRSGLTARHDRSDEHGLGLEGSLLHDPPEGIDDGADAAVRAPEEESAVLHGPPD